MTGKSKGEVCSKEGLEEDLHDQIYQSLTASEKKRRRRFRNEEIEAVYILAGGFCERCNERLGPTWEVDHIKPVSKGGETCIENAAALCQKCNRKKGSNYDEKT